MKKKLDYFEKLFYTEKKALHWKKGHFT